MTPPGAIAGPNIFGKPDEVRLAPLATRVSGDLAALTVPKQAAAAVSVLLG